MDGLLIPRGGAHPARHVPPAAPRSTIIARYDPSNLATLQFDVPTNPNSIINAANQEGDANHYGRQTGPTGPNYSTAGLSAGAMLFTGSLNEQLILNGTAGAFKNQAVIGCDAIILIPSALSGLGQYWSVFTSLSGTILQVQFQHVDATFYRIRTSSKPRTGDTNVNRTSTLKLRYGVPSYFAHQTNYQLGKQEYVGNDDVDPVTNINWTGGLGKTPNLNSAADSVMGRLTGTPGQTFHVSEPRFWVGYKSPKELLEHRVGLVDKYGAPLRTTFVMPPANALDLHRGYAFDRGTPVPRTIEVLYGGDTVIEGTLVDSVDLTTQAAGWGAWPSLGISSGNVLVIADLHDIAAIPPGDWLLKTREPGQDALSTATDTDHIGMVFVILKGGQSNEGYKHWIEQRIGPFASSLWPLAIAPTGSPVARKHRRNSGEGNHPITQDNSRTTVNNQRTGESTTKGTTLELGRGANGGAALALEFDSLCGMPMLQVHHMIGGVPYARLLPGGDSYNKIVATLDQPGGARREELQAMTLVGGENEIARPEIFVDRWTIVETLDGVAAGFCALTGNPNFIIFISITGPIVAGSTTDFSAREVRMAQLWVAKNHPNFRMLYNPLDQPLRAGDSQHLAYSCYPEALASREARTLSKYLYEITAGARGTPTGAYGPEIVSAVCPVGSNTITLSVVHDAGTTLEDSSGSTVGTGLKNFAAGVGGADRPLTAAYLDAGQIKLVFDGAPRGAGPEPMNVGYLETRRPDLTNMVFDDAGDPLMITYDRMDVTA